MRVYLDSCIAIYLIEQRGALAKAIRSRLAPPDAMPQVAYTDLTRLECRVWPLREGRTELLEAFDNFFSTPGFLRIGLDADLFDLATELRARQGLKTPDALHLAAALSAGCDEFWTNDDRLAKAAGKRMRLAVFNEQN